MNIAPVSFTGSILVIDKENRGIAGAKTTQREDHIVEDVLEDIYERQASFSSDHRINRRNRQLIDKLLVEFIPDFKLPDIDYRIRTRLTKDLLDDCFTYHHGDAGEKVHFILKELDTP